MILPFSSLYSNNLRNSENPKKNACIHLLADGMPSSGCSITYTKSKISLLMLYIFAKIVRVITKFNKKRRASFCNVINYDSKGISKKDYCFVN